MRCPTQPALSEETLLLLRARSTPTWLVKAMFALSTLWCLAALTVFPKETPPSLFPTALGHHLIHNGGLPFRSFGTTVNPLPTPSFLPVEFDLLPAFLTDNL